jgi:Subtilisin inhibitor-like
MPHLVATALAGAVLALLPALPAQAAAPTDLRLSVTRPAGNTSGSNTVTLRCEPSGGQHPRAAEACAELSRHDGAFDRPAGDTACTLEYTPVVAHATGLWRGRPVSFRREYSNSCVLRSHTGTIFQF